MNTSQRQQLSTKVINTLDTRLIPSANRVLDACRREEIPIALVWGRRTILEQNLLFRHGRTIPGDVLTTHRGGYSAHNYGLALDYCLHKQNQLIGWEDAYEIEHWHKQWLRIGRLFESEGWVSKWRSYDFEPGHVENLLGKTIGQLYAERRQAEDRDLWDTYLGEPDSDQDFYL